MIECMHLKQSRTIDGLHCVWGHIAIQARRDGAAPLRVTLNRLMSSQKSLALRGLSADVRGLPL